MKVAFVALLWKSMNLCKPDLTSMPGRVELSPDILYTKKDIAVTI
jgi:hypothetical protein